ncbi:MAG: aldo/keto reductase [Halobacteriaceae archaeon]
MAPLDVPPLGMGTWKLDDAVGPEAVSTALEMGYRHVDTAQVYGTEPSVREGLRRAAVDREDVVLATKIHEDGDGPGYEDVETAADRRLAALGVDVLDLLYVHWPVGAYDAAETLPAFAAQVERGVTRHVGVSNFTVDLLDEALDVLDVPLAAHQVEFHPFLPQNDLVAHAQANDYALVAYSPLARGQVLEHPVIRGVADKHGVSAAQVSLAWVLDHENVVAIPKASTEAHLRENLAATDLDLDPEDRERIDAIDRRERTVDRPDAPWNP